MEKVGLNEVQLSDMTKQFFQMNVQNTWKKGHSAILVSFLEFFKCSTNSKSININILNLLNIKIAKAFFMWNSGKISPGKSLLHL